MTTFHDDGIVVTRSDWEAVVIDGLKVTMSGSELRAKLEERIESHARQAAHWAKLRDEPPSEEGVCIPEHLVQHGIERAHDQVETLTFLRDHIIETETYRLGEYDLRFADLLPDSDFDCSCYPRDSNRKGTATPGLFDLVDDKEITEIAEARVTP